MDIEGLPKSSLIINQYLKSVKDVTKILLTLPNLIKIKFLGFIFHTKNGCITKNVGRKYISLLLSLSLSKSQTNYHKNVCN